MLGDAEFVAVRTIRNMKGGGCGPPLVAFWGEAGAGSAFCAGRLRKEARCGLEDVAAVDGTLWGSRTRAGEERAQM